MTNRHVLILPSGYPSVHSPVLGIFFKLQAQALHEYGHKVGVIYPDFRSLRTFSFESLFNHRFQYSRVIENGIFVIRYNAWNILSAKLRLYLQCKVTLKLVENYITTYGKPDILHSHCALWAGYAAKMVSDRFDIPFVVTEHSSEFSRNLFMPWQVALIEKTYCASSANIAVSNALSKITDKYRPNPVIKVIPNMVDTEFFTLPPRRRKNKPFVFLFIAILTKVKGANFLIEAFSRQFKGDMNFLLEIGGDGPALPELKVLANTFGITEQVNFLGRLSQAEVRNAMWRANAFVMPSLFETFGIVLIEAMSTGLPVIATRCGGPEDVLSEDRKNNGILVMPANSNALGNSMRYLFNNIGNYIEENIRESIIENFGQQEVAKRISAVYETVLSQN